MAFLNGTDPGLRQVRTPTVDIYTAGAQFTAGSSTQVSLSADPGTENNVIITFDGITQHRDTYAISGTTVTFDAAIATGVSKVEATYTTTIPAHEPADGSVSAAKLASGLGFGLTSTQVFTSSGTWTKPSGITKVKVIVIGGGGGGGGGTNNYYAGGGGGGGGTAIEIIDVSSVSSVSVTIGGGGAGAAAGSGGGAGSTGSTGVTSSFGSYCSATGGVGGAGQPGGSPWIGLGGAGGSGSGGTYNLTGSPGGNGIPSDHSSGVSVSGVGGSSFFGGGAKSVLTDSNGVAAGANTGGGGSGSRHSGTTGGAGGSGICVVEEYA